MGIVQWFKDKIAPAAVKSTPEIYRPHAEPDPRGPGPRVYHEYFVTERAEDMRFDWLCRVYSQEGICEQNGISDTREAACKAALWFATKTKLTLRGGV